MSLKEPPPGVVGASPPPTKRRRGNEEPDTPGMALRSTSTPRRSGRLKAKLNVEKTISCVKAVAVSRAKVVKPVQKPIIKPRASSSR